jgi:hypothetical protein
MGRYVPRGQIDRAWGHGFVHIKRLSDVPATGASRGVVGFEVRRVVVM